MKLFTITETFTTKHVYELDAIDKDDAASKFSLFKMNGGNDVEHLPECDETDDYDFMVED